MPTVAITRAIRRYSGARDGLAASAMKPMENGTPRMGTTMSMSAALAPKIVSVATSKPQVTRMRNAA
jgi:hypothetical protein